MATQEMEQLEAPSSDMKLDIEELVKEPTWKDLLTELVKRNQLDPWNIDIIIVVDKYIEAIKEMKVMDLRVPANIILAAAILLRLKGDMLSVEEPIMEPEPEMEHFARQPVEVEDLSIRLRLPPKRKITLTELISALDEAMKLKEVKEQRKAPKQIELPIKFNALDIETEMQMLYDRMKAIADKSNMLTFSYMLKSVEADDVLLGLFIPLLFLAHNNKIQLIQEKFFGDIIIALNG